MTRPLDRAFPKPASCGLLLLSLAFTTGLAAQDAAPAPKKALTLERIQPGQPFFRPEISRPVWKDAERFTWVSQKDRGLWQWDVKTGRKSRLLEPLPAPGTPPEGEIKKPLPFGAASYSPDGTLLLIPGGEDLFLYDFGRKELKPLTKDAAEEEYPTFSPDGKRVAYVKRNDLYAVEISSGKETRLTTAGADHVLNGKLDWVYEEELANRRSGRSYEWAPDGKAIAYLRLDENRVPEYPIVDFLPANGRLERQRYPKAGDPNAIPSVHVVDLEGRETASVTFTPDDLYVAPELTWTADSSSACYLVLDRPQTSLEVRLLARAGGPNASTRLLLKETDPAWINSLEPPRFLRDGSFLFLSERSGFLHLYRHAADGKALHALTRGDFAIEPQAPLELDEKGGWVYLVANESSPIERQVYRVKLDGTGFTRLSQGRGSHGLDLAPGGAHYLETFSDADTPPKLALHSASGARVAMVDDPGLGELADYALGKVETTEIKGADGTRFFGRLVKPPDFDAKKRYPVIVFVYGGPHSQVVQDRWRAVSAFDHLLASRGFLVWAMDNRGSAGRGHAFETPILKRLGEVELKDQLEGVRHLKSLPFVDPARIGLWGWSYGGFMASYAATHAPESFAAIVAGAPVTDWKYYDTIYTERYMKTPKENPEGYKASAPLSAADRMGTKLLILHGTSDDNVHMQQSIAFADALMRARKDFAFVPLPGQRHGPRDPAAALYVNQRILEFFEKNLR